MLPNGIQVEEEVEMISDFSWRNFFTVINLTKIMQKLTKGRPHRIMLLVHHKSTVSLLVNGSPMGGANFCMYCIGHL